MTHWQQKQPKTVWATFCYIWSPCSVVASRLNVIEVVGLCLVNTTKRANLIKIDINKLRIRVL